MPFIVFTVIRTHASLHVFVELANNGQHRLGYAETCEHHPPPLSVDVELFFILRSTKNINRGVLLARLSFSNRRTTNASNVFFLDTNDGLALHLRL